MPIINQKTREQSLQDNPFIQAYLNGQITDADIPALQAKYGGGMGGMDTMNQTPFQRLTTGARDILDRYPIGGGASREPVKSPSNDINTLMMREYVKNMFKDTKEETAEDIVKKAHTKLVKGTPLEALSDEERRAIETGKPELIPAFTPLQKSPLFKEGTAFQSWGKPNVAKLSSRARYYISQIKTEADYTQFLEDASKHGLKQDEINQVLEYFGKRE